MRILKIAGGTAAVGCLFYGGLLFQQWIAQGDLPSVDPKTDAYSKCVGKFMTDITTFITCIGDHASKRCWFDDHVMTDMEDSHNCLALITSVPFLTLNAKVVKAAHDICYKYLKSYGECLGLAIEMEEFEPCFRREVFARVGVIVDKCKNETGISDNDAINNTPTFSFAQIRRL